MILMSICILAINYYLPPSSPSAPSAPTRPICSICPLLARLLHLPVCFIRPSAPPTSIRFQPSPYLLQPSLNQLPTPHVRLKFSTSHSHNPSVYYNYSNEKGVNKMQNVPKGIPRPLVKTNQAFIVISVILTWLTGQHWILALPLFAGLLGLLFGYNPIIKLAARFLTKERSHYVLEDWSQQQFNQSIAVFCLAGGLISFIVGWTIAAYIFTALVAVAATVAILGFCIGCFIHYQWRMYNYRRKQSSTN